MLGVTYTQLLKQPDEWVNQMIDLYTAENKVSEFNQKKQALKNKKKRR